MPAPLTQSSPTLLSALPALYLYPLNDSFVPKHIALSTPGQRVKIGRQTNAKTTPGERNGYFDSKVLSRAHAEIWEEGGKIYIKDVKSSNGTFINGERLSQEGMESEPFDLKSDDIVEFGIDIVGEDNKTIVHHKVAARVVCIFNEQDALMAARSEQQHQPNSASLHQSSLASSSNGQPNMSSLPNPPKSNQFPPRLTGMGGMGGSMRPPGKSGLTFEHILTRLQGELQKSRDTGAELGALTGSMGEIGETLGGTLPPNAPAYPNPSSLPPVRPPPPAEERPAPPETDDKGKRPAVDELIEKLQEHEQKVRVLEDKLKEQEGMWNEIRGMLLAKQRAEEEEQEYHQQRERERNHHDHDYDDDDSRSIATVTGGLEPVDEEEEPEEDFSHHEQSLEHEQEHDQEHDQDERKQEHVRPRTPEPSLALQPNQASEPEPTRQPDYSSLITELTLKVSQLTEQLVESRGVIRGLEEKVASLSMTPATPPPVPSMEWMEKWEEMARRVGQVEATVEKVKETNTERKSVEEVLPPSPRSLSSDSMRHRRRGRSSSVHREPIDTLTVEVPKTNGVLNGNADLVKKENGEVKLKEPRHGLGPRKDATMTALGIVILGVAAAAVVWKVKE